MSVSLPVSVHSGAAEEEKNSALSIRAIVREVAAFFASVDTAINAANEYEALASLSDARLAEMGLKRPDILQYVNKAYLNA